MVSLCFVLVAVILSSHYHSSAIYAFQAYKCARDGIANPCLEHFPLSNTDTAPDSLYSFLKNRLADVVDDHFTQIVEMLVDGKFVSLDIQYVDGTKIEAAAGK